MHFLFGKNARKSMEDDRDRDRDRMRERERSARGCVSCYIMWQN